MAPKADYSKNPKELRPKEDLYHTPKCLTRLLLEVEDFSNVWEPACGDGAISDVLREQNILCCRGDITTGDDFFSKLSCYSNQIITNPPFYLWDEFALHALKLCRQKPDGAKIALIGRTNYFGCFGRSISPLWDYLEKVYVFNRMVDFRTPLRDDGCFHVGAMVTGWFIFKTEISAEIKLQVLNVQLWATLGQFKL